MLVQLGAAQKDLTLTIDDEEDHQDEEINNKIQDILSQGERYHKEAMPKELADLIADTKPFLTSIPKNKAAKLLSSLVDLFLDLEFDTGIGVRVCQDCVDWATEQNMIYLRRTLEFKLLVLYFDCGMHTEVLKLNSNMLKELEKLDDKDLLIEVKLLESRTLHALGNIPKARSSLTSARIIADSIYCQPKILAWLDLQSGVLLASEQNFEIAFSYFSEAFQSFDSLESPKALTALKYMLLAKLMLQSPEEMENITSMKYSGRHVDAMKSLARASRERSLAKFMETLHQFKHELQDDIIVKAHLDALYDTMFEQNLCKVIEPYSKVEIGYISEAINLPKNVVQSKLCQMILDKKISGSLLQEEEVLIVENALK